MSRASLHRNAPAWTGALVAVSLLLAAPGPCQSGRNAEGTRYRLGVEVRYGDEAGPRRFIESLRRELLREIESQECFASVESYRPEGEDPPDLLLSMIIHDINDRTEYETSMANRHEDRGMPNEKQPMVITIEAVVDLRLLLLPDMLVVRSRDFRERGTFRPTYREDPRYEVELRVQETLAREGRSLVCKGAGKKLSREIERARTGAN